MLIVAHTRISWRLLPIFVFWLEAADAVFLNMAIDHRWLWIEATSLWILITLFEDENCFVRLFACRFFHQRLRQFVKNRQTRTRIKAHHSYGLASRVWKRRYNTHAVDSIYMKSEKKKDNFMMKWTVFFFFLPSCRLLWLGCSYRIEFQPQLPTWHIINIDCNSSNNNNRLRCTYLCAFVQWRCMQIAH